MRAQAALEYLIIIAAILAISAVVVFFVSGAAGAGKSEAMYRNCQQAAGECLAMKAINPNNPCNVCDDKCIDLIAEEELFPGAIQCCKEGRVEDIYEGATSCPTGPGPTPPVCGDGTCDPGENNANCPADCPAAEPWTIEEFDYTFTGYTGETISLALDSNNRPHIVYRGSPNLGYLYFDGVDWNQEDIEPTGFTYPSIVLDTSNVPHISYFASDGLKYARWTGTNWDTQSLAFAGDHHEGYTSLALDSNGNPHITSVMFDYPIDTARYINYTYFDGAVWHTELVDPGTVVNGANSLALDSSNNPHVIYFDNTNYDLKYAHWTGSSWTIEVVVDLTEYSGEDLSLALDSSNNPHISYSDGNVGGDLKYAHWTGSTWDIQTVESTGNMGMNSLALDSSNNPHISYMDSANNAIKYAHWTGSSWDSQIVEQGTADHVGAYCSIAIDYSNGVHIAYYGDDGLAYAHNI